MMKISDFITKHVSYTSSNDMNAICRPLFDDQVLGFNLFSVSRYYNDGKCVHLTTSRDALYHHVTRKHPFCGTIITQGINLWDNYLPAESQMELAEYFHFHNGISFCSQHSSYTEIYNLASSRQDTSVIGFYLNHMDLIKKFFMYFKDKGHNLLQAAKQQPLIVPKTEYRGSMDDRYNRMDSLIKPRYVRLMGDSLEIVLSAREYECLAHMAMGKTVKEVARIVNISPRTVEQHLFNAKLKANCNFKSELIDIYWANNSYSDCSGADS